MKFILEKIPVIKTNEMISLSGEEQKKYYALYNNFEPYFMCKINDEPYHKKIVNKDIIINELLGKLISEYFKDNQQKSIIVRNEMYTFYLLTKNFFQEGYTYSELRKNLFPKLEVDENKKLSIISLELLDEYSYLNDNISTNKKDLVKLQYKLKMMIINDFMRKQSDRWYQNFLIAYNDKHCKLMPLFDFEHSFLEYDKQLDNSFEIDFSDDKIREYIRNDDQFQELLNLAMDLNMDNMFEKMFDKYPVRAGKDELNIYEQIIDESKENIKRYKLIK